MTEDERKRYYAANPERLRKLMGSTNIGGPVANLMDKTNRKYSARMFGLSETASWAEIDVAVAKFNGEHVS